MGREASMRGHRAIAAQRRAPPWRGPEPGPEAWRLARRRRRVSARWLPSARNSGLDRTWKSVAVHEAAITFAIASAVLTVCDYDLRRRLTSFPSYDGTIGFSTRTMDDTIGSIDYLNIPTHGMGYGTFLANCHSNLT